MAKRASLKAPARRIIVCAWCLAASLATPLLTAPQSAAIARQPLTALSRFAPGSSVPWCGNSSTADLVCRWRGAVFSDQVLLPKRRPRPDGESIVTGPGSEAHLSFASQADCTLDESSQIFPRQGARNSLYSEQYGSSSCSSPVSHSAVSLLCKAPLEPCPAEVRVKGTVLLRSPPEGAARASSGETLRRRVRIVLCAGFLRVFTAEGSEAAGGASGNNRYVIFVEELSSHSEAEGTSEESGSTAIKVIGRISGRGDCAVPVIEEEESTTYGF